MTEDDGTDRDDRADAAVAVADLGRAPANRPGGDRRRPIGEMVRTVILIGAVFGSLAVAAIAIDGLTDSAERSDVLVVLGTETRVDGTPSSRLQARLDAAADAFEAGLAEWIIVSGGIGRSGWDESEVMARYLIEERGIDPDVVILDPDGVNTRATAVNARATMEERGWTSALVVSQYYHLPRTRLAFRQEGIDDVTTYHARFHTIDDSRSLVREVVAISAYLIGAR